MRVASEDLAQYLKWGLSKLYVIHGAEALLALEAADLLRSTARAAGFVEREVFTIEPGFDSSTLLAGSRSQSLFATQKIIEVRVPSGKPGVEGAATLQRYCADLGDDVFTLVLLPKLDRATLTSAWFTALEGAGVVVIANEVARAQLPVWLQARLTRHGLHADEVTLQFLANRVEGNLLAAHHEVQKLALLFPPGPLTFDAVKDAVLDVARFDVFGLGSAMLSGNAARFVRTLSGLREEGEAPPLMLWSITEELRAMLKIKLGVQGGLPMAQLLRDARVWGPRQAMIERAIKRVSVQTLSDALLKAAQCDRMIKGVARGDVWDELMTLGLRIAAPNFAHAVNG